MWIFCCGMRRSGSTLQYQITAHLVESAGRGNRVDWVKPSEFPELARQNANVEGWKVFKNHVCTKAMAEEFHRQNALGVYCYRDPRDVVVSSLQKWNFSFDDLWRSGLLQKDLENYKKWTRLPGVLVSKYEEMIRDLPTEVLKATTSVTGSARTGSTGIPCRTRTTSARAPWAVGGRSCRRWRSR